MSLRKLTAGDGYAYLTHQVASHDATETGHRSLEAYYSEKGESPGRWLGRGLAGLGVDADSVVTTEQMRSLFGLGHHPDADSMRAQALELGQPRTAVARVGRLGRAFAVYETASTFNRHAAEAFSDYNRDRGKRWDASIPAETRAAIRTSLARAMFAEAQGREPADARELSGFLARASRQTTTAVAGFDLCFSPVKSVSALWALADTETADKVRAAHEAAVAATIGWIEDEVAHTRVGQGGIRQIKVRGLVAAAFTHRDSRAGDPDLHTHVAVSNKVQAQDGRWLALDGRVLYAAKVAASEHYNSRLETELTARLGVKFTEREPRRSVITSEKRQVREITGISPSLLQAWSRRRTMITARQSELAQEFQRAHGRVPTAVEAIALGDQATLETRAAKHSPRSEAEQRITWRREATAVLGGTDEVDAMLRHAIRRQPPGRQMVRDTMLDDEWVHVTATSVVAAVESRRAIWQVWHLRAEAEYQVRRAGVRRSTVDRTTARHLNSTPSATPPEAPDDAVEPDPGCSVVELVVEEAIRQSLRLDAHADGEQGEPAALRRPDGHSVYELHGARRYTSRRILESETQILAAAGRRCGRMLGESRVSAAIAGAAAGGLELNDAQAGMVRDLATCGRGVRLALAPAGTGKTTTMRVLADAWRSAGGVVIGLAPSAQAAHELHLAVGGHTDTLAKFTWTLNHHAETRGGTAEPAVSWVYDIGPDTMVIVDEAGQAGTGDLAILVDHVIDRGGCVRLVGDDQQLAAVPAGGVLRDLHREHGAATLSEVRRFESRSEAAATLALREGDPTALGFYADHGRIHVGDLGAVTEQAFAAWATDRADGKDAVLLAPTRDLVSELNARGRATLRGHSSSDPGLAHAITEEREVRLHDGNFASRGDIVVTRRNARALLVSPTNWVKNGDRWRVDATRHDGGLRVRHLELDRVVDLPTGYVAEHVELGYACTVHGAQGMTTDTTHVVATGREDRQTLYVALTRGRAANHVYLAVAHDGDPHTLVERETLLPPTALDVLTRVLQCDGSQQSATTAHLDATDPRQRLHDTALRFADSLTYAAEDALGTTAMRHLDEQLEALFPTIRDQDAYPTLRAHLALQALQRPETHASSETLGNTSRVELDAAAWVSPALTRVLDAAAQRSLVDATDLAAVLHARLEEMGTDHTDQEVGPLPWLPAVPAALQRHPVWGPYLARRAVMVTGLADEVRDLDPEIDAAHGDHASWTRQLQAPEHAALRSELLVWRAAFDIPDDDHRPTGPPRHSHEAGSYQRLLKRRVRAATTRSRAERSSELLPDDVLKDPRLAALRKRLGGLHAAGIDVDDLVRRALAEPRPLPDECAAGALWWRITSHLGPATLRSRVPNDPDTAPSWRPHLEARIGTAAAASLHDDPMWPALLAVIRSRPHGWSAEDLIDAALSGPQAAHADHLCETLVWRIATMTDPPDDEPTEPPEPPEQFEPADCLALATAEGTPHPDHDPRARIAELNHLALAHFADLYERSWCPTYLKDRLGVDLSCDVPFTLGYAAPGPTNLVQHLRRLGIDDNELVEAGLARIDAAGRIRDTFRDRLIFPIRDGTTVVGLVGRRNPSRNNDVYAGPKYLNTRTTPLFTKGKHLFGLTEAASLLQAGATPVLVEGPLDALAVTVAGAGEFVGIAPLGTSFTRAQAERLGSLRAQLGDVVIATDGDAPGAVSAQRIYWRLAASGPSPRALDLPAGTDPAEALRRDGARGLRSYLHDAKPAPEVLISRALRTRADLDAAGRIWLARDVAGLIGSAPPTTWPRLIAQVDEQLRLPDGLLPMEVIEAGEQWTEDPSRRASNELARLRRPVKVAAHRPQGALGVSSRTADRVDRSSGGWRPRRAATNRAPQLRRSRR